MINIYINGMKADFFGSLTIKKDSPLLSSFGIEPTEHTYTLTLPTTATNAKIFSLVQYTLATPQKLPAYIDVDGVRVLNGSCNVQSWSESGYSVYFSGIAPYEDVNTSSIKKMLGDTRKLKEFITIAERAELTGYLGDVGVYYTYTYNGATYPAVVSADTYGWRANNNDAVGVVSNKSNATFAVGYLLQWINSTFGINVQLLPMFADLMVMQYGVKDTYSREFEGQFVEYVRLSSSLPQMTAKQFIENIAVLAGCKMRVDYANNSITFVSLDSLPASSAQLHAKIKNINYNSELPMQMLSFTDIKPFEHKFKNVNDDEMTTTASYSIATKVAFNEEATEEQDDKNKNKGYTSLFSIPYVKNGIVVTPLFYDEGDDRLDNIIVVKYEDYTLKPAKLAIENNFQFFKIVGTHHIGIKFTARLNPVEFTNLDMWKPINIDNVGKAFIKSINFKPDGESDIEAYLY